MEKAMKGLADVIGMIAGILFLALFIANIIQILNRYLFGISFLWVPDLTRMLFIWVVFLGGATAYIRKQHLMIDFVKDKFSHRTVQRTDELVDLVMVGFLILLIVKGIRITLVRLNIPYDSWNVPTAVAYVAVPVAGFIMLLATVSRRLDAWKG